MDGIFVTCTYLEGSVVALITDVYEYMRAHVRVAHYAQPIVLLAQSTQRNARLLPAENQVGMMPRHCLCQSTYLYECL
jgi:hypothetical protein